MTLSVISDGYGISSFILTEETKQIVKGVDAERIFAAVPQDVAEERRQFHNENIRNSYSSTSIITTMRSIVHSQRRESHRKQMHVISSSLLE
jgi:hypothetical protein